VRVRRVVRLTSRGRTVEWAGTRRTSSNVSAFCMTRIRTTLRRKTRLYRATPTRTTKRLPRALWAGRHLTLRWLAD